MDLPMSIHLDNLYPMLRAGWANMPLTKYLLGELRKTKEERFASLLEYYPEANPDDWELITAGQRVQIIKKDSEKGGVLQFGTEIVAHAINRRTFDDQAHPPMLPKPHPLMGRSSERACSRLRHQAQRQPAACRRNHQPQRQSIGHPSSMMGRQ